MNAAHCVEAELITRDQDEALLARLFEISREQVRDDTALLLGAMADQALSGSLVWEKNLTVSINRAIEEIDATISRQLAKILHHSDFSMLEGSWRGLQQLVYNSETSNNLKIRVLNISKGEIRRDLSRAVEFDQSQLFAAVYESEFGTAGGEPYGVLLGDFEFTAGSEDVAILSGLSQIAAAGFAPFISAASPHMFGLEHFSDLSRPRDLENIFSSTEYVRWRSFRESEDSRFVSLVLPRVLARSPYGAAAQSVDAFRFEELPLDSHGRCLPATPNNFCWMNACYAMGIILTRAFAEHGWCTQIRGMESGGRTASLPFHAFTTEDGDRIQQCPTETGITDRREAELSRLGFLPLCHYKNTDYAVFFGSQSAHKPKKFDDSHATANEAISARLPYLLATSRIAHYLKIMARDRVGSCQEAAETEAWLNRWISHYCNSNAGASAETKARFPLAEARIEVKEVVGSPGCYRAIAYLRPWLQMEELTASLRLVANIPASNQA